MTQEQINGYFAGFYWAGFSGEVQPVEISEGKDGNLVFGIGLQEPIPPGDVNIIWPISPPEKDITNQVLGT